MPATWQTTPLFHLITNHKPLATQVLELCYLCRSLHHLYKAMQHPLYRYLTRFLRSCLLMVAVMGSCVAAGDQEEGMGYSAKEDTTPRLTVTREMSIKSILSPDAQDAGVQ